MAEIQTVESNNLPIFGQTHDLLQNVFTSKDVCIHSKGNTATVSTAGMTVSLKTDLRFSIPGQEGHGSRIIHLKDELHGFRNIIHAFSRMN